MKRYAYLNLFLIFILVFLFSINFFVLIKTSAKLEEYRLDLEPNPISFKKTQIDNYLSDYLKFKEQQKIENENIKKKLSQTSAAFEPKKIFEKTIKSVVAIIDKNKIIGNGVMLSESMILSNYHIVNETKSGSIKFYDGIQDEADVILFDKTKDLALLQTKNKHSGSKTTFAKNNIVTGDKIAAIGSTQLLDFAITSGIINSIRTSKEGMKYLQIDASTNVGYSGSPLLNSNAELIGMVTLKATNLEGVSFAIHLDEINEFLKTAILFG